jgi:hypothetical protein
MDVVETDYSGKVTTHVIMERFKTRNCQTGVTYKVIPAVPKSGGKESKIDHAWFKKIGFFRLDRGDVKFESTK